MRHTEHIIIGSDHYVVSAKVMKEVEAVLKKSRAKTVEQTAEGASALAHVLYPQIDDPVQGGGALLTWYPSPRRLDTGCPGRSGGDEAKPYFGNGAWMPPHR